jgi:hypothetical protein
MARPYWMGSSIRCVNRPARGPDARATTTMHVRGSFQLPLSVRPQHLGWACMPRSRIYAHATPLLTRAAAKAGRGPG